MNNSTLMILVAVAGLAVFALYVLSAINPAKAHLAQADNLFKLGKFHEAKDAYAKVLLSNKQNVKALLQLAMIAQLENHLEESVELFKQALEQMGNAPKDVQRAAWQNLAVTYARMDRFPEAADAYEQAGIAARAHQLAAFKDTIPYQMGNNVMDETQAKFVVAEPLPVIEVRVNGSEPVLFLIDTGAPETVLDPEFASKVNAERFGKTTGTFAGGKKADVEHGRIESITIGDFTIKNVPIGMLNTKQFGPIFGGKEIEGIIGTTLLSHFLNTLDYVQGTLILRKKTPEILAKLEAQAGSNQAISMPFWMAGDHIMVAWGTLNKSKPMLFFVDTGLAGGGFTASEKTLKEAHVVVDSSKAGEGIGGGGKVRIVPILVPELTLGDAREENIAGFVGDSSLEDRFGFRIGGLISHQFFRPYALTFDFIKMRLFLERKKR